MSTERASSDGSSIDDLLTELSDAARRVEDLLEHVGTDRAADLAAVRAALLKAHRTVAAQSSTVGELAVSVQALGRELLESHAKFSEWALTPELPGARGGSS